MQGVLPPPPSSSPFFLLYFFLHLKATFQLRMQSSEKNSLFGSLMKSRRSCGLKWAAMLSLSSMTMLWLSTKVPPHYEEGTREWRWMRWGEEEGGRR